MVEDCQRYLAEHSNPGPEDPGSDRSDPRRLPGHATGPAKKASSRTRKDALKDHLLHFHLRGRETTANASFFEKSDRKESWLRQKVPGFYFLLCAKCG